MPRLVNTTPQEEARPIFIFSAIAFGVAIVVTIIRFIISKIHNRHVERALKEAKRQRNEARKAYRAAKGINLFVLDKNGKGGIADFISLLNPKTQTEKRKIFVY